MAVCALGMMAGTTWGQITFTHSQGQLKTNAESNETTGIYQNYYSYTGALQQTHEYTKTIYIAKGKSKRLEPYVLVSSYRNKYFRWFWYNSESQNSELEKYTNIESMTSLYSKTDNGYIAVKPNDTSDAGFANNETTNYYPMFDYAGDIPAEGIKIAMEASNSTSVPAISSNFTEPTLASGSISCAAFTANALATNS